MINAPISIAASCEVPSKFKPGHIDPHAKGQVQGWGRLRWMGFAVELAFAEKK
jgi:hypothetical protein